MIEKLYHEALEKNTEYLEKLLSIYKVLNIILSTLNMPLDPEAKLYIIKTTLIMYMRDSNNPV